MPKLTLYKWCQRHPKAVAVAITVAEAVLVPVLDLSVADSVLTNGFARNIAPLLVPISFSLLCIWFLILWNWKSDIHRGYFVLIRAGLWDLAVVFFYHTVIGFIVSATCACTIFTWWFLFPVTPEIRLSFYANVFCAFSFLSSLPLLLYRIASERFRFHARTSSRWKYFPLLNHLYSSESLLRVPEYKELPIIPPSWDTDAWKLLEEQANHPATDPIFLGKLILALQFSEVAGLPEVVDDPIQAVWANHPFPRVPCEREKSQDASHSCLHCCFRPLKRPHPEKSQGLLRRRALCWQITQAVARNPNTRFKDLADLANLFPAEVLENPSFQLTLLAQPELVEQLSWTVLLRFTALHPEQWEPLLLRWLRLNLPISLVSLTPLGAALRRDWVSIPTVRKLYALNDETLQRSILKHAKPSALLSIACYPKQRIAAVILSKLHAHSVIERL